MVKVLMLAAENAALKDAKAGGMGDVVRDLPLALTDEGAVVDIIMPDYGRLVEQCQAKQVATIVVSFSGQNKRLSLFVTKHPHLKSSIYFIQNPLWKRKGNSIYIDSGARPFADDANCFALFSLGVATFVARGFIPKPDVFHLNDWHSGFFTILTKFDSTFSDLKQIHSVFTVHNLALQGIRPLANDDSSLESWYPGLYANLTKTQLAKIKDPRYHNCVNPLRAAINLCDGIHIVSPTYAQEVLKPSNPEAGFFGGEGLEKDLRKRSDDTLGVLNGHIYKSTRRHTIKFSTFLKRLLPTMSDWQDAKPITTYEPREKVSELILNKAEPGFLLTSVGRLTDQKALILRQQLNPKQLVLDVLLDELASYSDTALFILLGSGDPLLEATFHEVASRHKNFLFLNGYNEEVSEWLYECGDLFLMPSSFEPCGISQMLAMQYGQPCLVHGVGGLNDTVRHLENGFSFQGNNLKEQSQQLIVGLKEALNLVGTPKWKTISKRAKAERFTWQDTAKEIVAKLY
ncbi:MAG: glycosyltransferase [Enterobacterales bacterium]|nr:glycosyltransferase [Enterobacterales bacterium]